MTYQHWRCFDAVAADLGSDGRHRTGMGSTAAPGGSGWLGSWDVPNCSAILDKWLDKSLRLAAVGSWLWWAEPDSCKRSAISYAKM